ncbi:probable protein phosphatase 2C 80 [Syzygium oleosum]|uniref:probable protein phosphatase 2C 80 n=1 Tax=Syzygium oleosum TaxID=219896 RepID=UPI0024BB3D3F|nr:probable protein phosphatase 2C 80 [Syzygium oleosum]
MVAGSCYVPKKRAGCPEGDDAHFVCPEKGIIGVSDGVGGWVRHGVDPEEYARGLMTSCADEVGRQEASRVDLEAVLGAAFGRTSVGSSYKVAVREGDIIIAGTDGLFDNMFMEQIKDVAEAGMREGKDLGAVAASIAARACANSLDKATRTPFCEGSEKHGKEHRRRSHRCSSISWEMLGTALFRIFGDMSRRGESLL